MLDAIQRDNVTLVTSGIRRITETGIEDGDGRAPRRRRHRLRHRLPRDGLPVPDDDHRARRPDDRARTWAERRRPRAPLLHGAGLPEPVDGLRAEHQRRRSRPRRFHEVVTRYALECMEHLIVEDKRAIEVTERRLLALQRRRRRAQRAQGLERPASAQLLLDRVRPLRGDVPVHAGDLALPPPPAVRRARDPVMEHRHLGRTGVSVSKLCLGAMMLGPWGTDGDEGIRIIHAALDAGINFIDTADAYSAGGSEAIVGQALRGRRDEVVLATKLVFPLGEDDDPNRRGASRRWIVQAVEDSLRRLETDYIDLYQVHRPTPETELEETLGALDDLVHQGKVRYVGHSTYPASLIVEAQWTARDRGLVRPHTEQPPYSILNRAVESEILPVCRQYGLGVIPWSPLAGGFLSGRAGDALADVARPRSTDGHLRPRAARQPAQDRGGATAGRARRRGRPHTDPAGDRVRAQPPGGHRADHRTADDGAPREPARRRRRDAVRGRPGPHRRDRAAGRHAQPGRRGSGEPGPSTGFAGAADDTARARDPRGRRGAADPRRRARARAPRRPARSPTSSGRSTGPTPSTPRPTPPGWPASTTSPRSAADAQDDELRELEGSAFFELVRAHVLEGMFGDPQLGRQRRPGRLAPARLPGAAPRMDRGGTGARCRA